MGKYLLIAEKPSLMRDLQATYKKHITDIQKKVGEIEFISLVGHVCRLIQPKEYPKWDGKWKDLKLPLIPEPFKILSIPSANNVIKDVKEKLKNGNYTGIIVATDPDVEGNGIYYLLSEYLGIKKMKTLRFFIYDQTDAELYKSYMNMTDYWKNPRDVNMTNAFLIRSHMDWLIGMNFTIGLTVSLSELIKTGRVKTPTLKLVYDNCKEIDEFVPHTDFGIDAVYTEGFKGSLLDDDAKIRRFKTKKEAEDYAKTLGSSAVVTEISKKTEKTLPPQFYNLSDLQADAGAKFGYTPKETLDLVQSLYETHKIVSYPRTDGRYVSSEHAKDFSALIKTVSAFPELHAWCDKVGAAAIKKAQGDKRIVDDKEVSKSSHDALLPTKATPNIEKLSLKEKNICLLIYRRFLAQFFDALEEEKVSLTAKIDEDTFRSTGKKVLKEGWTAVYEKKSEDTSLPDLKKGSALTVFKFEETEKTTQPPKRLTQASLVSAMVNINRYIDDKGLKKVMKEVHGLGTEASRASIISDLIKDGYMEEKAEKRSKGLYITPMGKYYIESLSSYDITKPELTAIWETKMKEIREGTRDFEKTYAEMLEYVKETVKKIEKSPTSKPKGFNKGETGLNCPVCGGPVLKSKFGWYCKNKMEKTCSFSIPLEYCGKTITETSAKDLIMSGKTKKLKGFKSKAGKVFDAAIKLENGKLSFDF